MSCRERDRERKREWKGEKKLFASFIVESLNFLTFVHKTIHLYTKWTKLWCILVCFHPTISTVMNAQCCSIHTIWFYGLTLFGLSQNLYFTFYSISFHLFVGLLCLLALRFIWYFTPPLYFILVDFFFKCSLTSCVWWVVFAHFEFSIIYYRCLYEKT